MVFASQLLDHHREYDVAIAVALIIPVDQQPVQPDTAKWQILPELTVHGEAYQLFSVIDAYRTPAFLFRRLL